MKKKIIEIILLLFIIFEFIATYCLLSFDNYNVLETKNYNYLIYNGNEYFNNGSLVRFKKMDNCVNIKEGENLYYVLSPDIVLKGIVSKREENMDNDAIIISDNYTKCDRMLGKEYKEYKNIGKFINFVTNRKVYFFLILLPTVGLLIYEVFLIKNNIKKETLYEKKD